MEKVSKKTLTEIGFKIHVDINNGADLLTILSFDFAERVYLEVTIIESLTTGSRIVKVYLKMGEGGAELSFSHFNHLIDFIETFKNSLQNDKNLPKS